MKAIKEMPVGPAPFPHGASETKQRPWPDPTPEMLATPEFESVWQCIKRWDINVPDAYVGYCGATGNHVRAILDALSTRLDPFGCHKKVAQWLESGKYRHLIHRHDGTFGSADESENKMMRADTLPLLADALMNWPDDAEVIPPSQWVKISAEDEASLRELREFLWTDSARGMSHWRRLEAFDKITGNRFK